MKCYVIEDGIDYLLINNPDKDTTTNADWVDYLDGTNSRFDELKNFISDNYVLKSGDTMTGALTNSHGFVGNASSASKLNPGATINGLLFDGTKNIEITHVKSADTIGGQTIDQIINQSIGISASQISQNGYVQFKNGLLFNWGRSNGGWTPFAKPFSAAVYAILSGKWDTRTDSIPSPRNIQLSGYTAEGGRPQSYLAIGV